jgi:hypothetical protein
MIVVVTGGRDYKPSSADAWALRAALRFHGATTVRHGACRGVDEWAGKVGTRLGLRVEPVPADWKKHGRAAGPIRNRHMLDGDERLKPADVTISLPGNEGTADCVSAARERGLPVTRIGGAS